MSDPKAPQPLYDPPPTSPGGQSQPTENDLKKHKQELGWLGGIFGARDTAPIFITFLLFILIVICLLAMAIGPWLPGSSSVSLADYEKIFSGIVIALITFLGGYLSGGNKS